MTSIALRGPARTWWVAFRALLLLIVLTVLYTAVVTVVGQLVLPAQANGSQVQVGGKTVGSALIGQSFTDKKGNALPQWFQSRPSAAGDGYDAQGSSASNLGPTNPDLVKAIQDRQKALRQSDGAASNGPGSIPADAVTTSGSGLDPHISPAYALLQVNRVAQARGLDAAKVRALVGQYTQAPDLGYLGQPTVNVLRLNIALAQLSAAG